MPAEPPRRPDLLGPIALAVIIGLMLGGYFAFPWLHRALSNQDCIASGRITGC